jgi:hypothetical protein
MIGTPKFSQEQTGSWSQIVQIRINQLTGQSPSDKLMRLHTISWAIDELGR